MICTRCFSHRTHVVETRSKRYEVMRRQECYDCGDTFRTVEIPDAVLGTIGRNRLAAAIERFERGVTRRSASRELRGKIVPLIEAGWKPVAIANEIGCAQSLVNKIGRQLREVGKQKLEGGPAHRDDDGRVADQDRRSAPRRDHLGPGGRRADD